MSSRVQAHCGPLPNETTSQGWISATSITVGQLWARNGAHQFGEQTPAIPPRRTAPCWAGLAVCKLVRFGWTCCCARRVVWSKNCAAEVWRHKRPGRPPAPASAAYPCPSFLLQDKRLLKPGAVRSLSTLRPTQYLTPWAFVPKVPIQCKMPAAVCFTSCMSIKKRCL